MKKLLVCCLLAFVGGLAEAVPSVSQLKVTPIPPWGLAIDYSVSGATTKEEKVIPTVHILYGTDKKTYNAKTLLGDATFANGEHRIYWDATKEGLTADWTNATVQLIYTPTAKKTGRYCVIDLSAGPNATYYPVTYTDTLPDSSGFNIEEYKTTKLVLQRVNEGSFIMGQDQSIASHKVTLTKPFYLGLFEVTQKQWELVMGSNPSDNNSGEDSEMCPVDSVSYDMIRGTSYGAHWPEHNQVDRYSFLGKLRARTDVDFDLPTEAQWEYACRAGTDTAYSYGQEHESEEANGEYMWYYDNAIGTSHIVGTKKANPWGFYDMHGNVFEWCLDNGGTELSYGTDPKGSSSSSTEGSIWRVLRGGSYISWSDGDACTSFYRSSSSSSSKSYTMDYCLGFRLALHTN